MSAQMNSPLPNILRVPWASTSRNTHAGLKNEDAGYEGVLSPELREEAPNSDPDGGAGNLKQNWLVSRYKNFTEC